MLETENNHSRNSTTLNGSWNQEGVLLSYQKRILQPYPAASVLSTCWNEVVALVRDKHVKRVTILVIFKLICLCFLIIWCSSSQSMALQAFTFTVGFNLLSLMSSIISVWVGKNGPSPLFSFGYERFEVLTVFVSTVLAQLGSMFIVKESIERLVFDQPQIHVGHLMIGTGVGFLSHIVAIYGCHNAVLDHVIATSSSSWLQEHVTDLSQSICSVLPILSGLLLPRANPMLLIACTAASAILLTDLLIQLQGYYIVDTLAALSIASITFLTMLPLSIYSGKVLLQTTPAHVVGQLDRCLRETLTLDGVLEFRNEHFWTLSFGKLAGSLQVRVHREADEQLVLAHVVDRLSNLVSVLTVQVFKDDWTIRKGGTATSNLSILNSSSSVKIDIPSKSVTVQNGKSLSYNTVIPFSKINPNMETIFTSTINYPLHVTRETPQNMWNYPTSNSHIHTHSQEKYEFLTSPLLQPEAYTNNLLISGTKTLDSNKLLYQPQKF